MRTWCWRARPRHPLAHRSALGIAELQGQHYVHFDRSLVIRREVDRFLKEQRVGVEVVMEFDNIEQIKNAVALGNGVALLPEPTLRHAVKARDLVAVPLGDGSFTRPLGIIHRRRPRLSVAARRFLDLLLDENAASVRRNGKAALAHTTARTRTDGADDTNGVARPEVLRRACSYPSDARPSEYLRACHPRADEPRQVDMRERG